MAACKPIGAQCAPGVGVGWNTNSSLDFVVARQIDRLPDSPNMQAMLESSSAASELPSFLHRSDRGELRMWLAAPTVLVFKYKGYSDAGYIPFVEDVYARTLASHTGPTYVFVDCEDQTGYAPAFRAGIVEWSKYVVPRTHTYCLFVKSRLVALGVTLARLAVGGRAAHAEVVCDRTAFRSKLETAVRRSFRENEPANGASSF
jgi:hypothetical protein